MDMNNIKSVYFIGAGGIGMSAIARYFLSQGKIVAGYDRTSSELTARLVEEGALIHYEEGEELIPLQCRDKETTLVVYTPAIPAEHKELVWFRENGFEIQKNREPQNDYLIPMVKTKVVYRKPKMKSIAGELNFKLSRNTHKQKIILEAKQETLIRRMFKKGKKREISSNFEVYNARQL
jgi:hypothetical protein